jgi:outer membrane beta-barrel protein
MEAWNQRIFIIIIVVLCVGHVFAAEPDANNTNIDLLLQTDRDRREITRAQLDTEDFEFGLASGIINIEDFGSSNVNRLRLALHVSEDFFLEADYGRTRLQLTSFERLSGAAQLLSERQREVSYYTVAVGYKLFPSEIYLGNNYAFYGNGYLTLGAGNVNFAGENHASTVFGAGLQLFPTDWLALHVSLRDHLFEHDLLGAATRTQNLEATLGISAYF